MPQCEIDPLDQVLSLVLCFIELIEHSVALALSLCRKIPQAHDRMRSQNYELSGLVGFQMKGKTVGIWGTGAIGTAAVGIYRGLGCRVLVSFFLLNAEICAALDFPREWRRERVK